MRCRAPPTLRDSILEKEHCCYAIWLAVGRSQRKDENVPGRGYSPTEMRATILAGAGDDSCGAGLGAVKGVRFRQAVIPLSFDAESEEFEELARGGAQQAGLPLVFPLGELCLLLGFLCGCAFFGRTGSGRPGRFRRLFRLGRGAFLRVAGLAGIL